jgi:hypothetical protein
MVYNQIWLNLLKKWTITSLATSQNQGGTKKKKKTTFQTTVEYFQVWQQLNYF